MADSRLLAAIPVTAGLVCAALMLPRAAPPSDVPLPVPDDAIVRSQAASDDALAEARMKSPLNPDVRALGTALRMFHLSEAEHKLGNDVENARLGVERAYREAVAAASDDEILALRAVQLHLFLRELDKFEDTGIVSAELAALGGTFIDRTREAGWTQGTSIRLRGEERRVLWKQWFNIALKKEDDPRYRLVLDEQRVLYALYLAHPVPAEDRRRGLETARTEAKTARECESIATALSLATDELRMKRVIKLATIDPDYPAAYARGVLEYRRGHFDVAANAFQEWVDTHTDGPWTARARNHLLAALHVR